MPVPDLPVPYIKALHYLEPSSPVANISGNKTRPLANQICRELGRFGSGIQQGLVPGDSIRDQTSSPN